MLWIHLSAGSLKECSLTVGDVVGHKCVSRVNNSVVLLL